MSTEEILSGLSILAITFPIAILIRKGIKALFLRELVIKDRKGDIIRKITRDNIVRDDPEELRKLHKDITRRISHGNISI
jgi:hypothetical protein